MAVEPMLQSVNGRLETDEDCLENDGRSNAFTPAPALELQRQKHSESIP